MAGRPLSRPRNSAAFPHHRIGDLVGDLSDIVEHLKSDRALLQRGFAGEAELFALEVHVAWATTTLSKILKLVTTARDQLSE